MNQSEYNKQIAELRKLAKFSRYIYGMKLYEVYPCHWVGFIKNAEILAKESLVIKDNGSFLMEPCHN